MPYPRKQTLTPASLVARRRNALKSTGPRAASGKALVALNSIRHGVNSLNYRKNLIQSGEQTKEYGKLVLTLIAVLHPRTRLALLRLGRYANMLWTHRRRNHKLVTRLVRLKGAPLTKTEIDLQMRIMKDLMRARNLATTEQRRVGARMENYILHLGLDMCKYAEGLLKADQFNGKIQREKARG